MKRVIIGLISCLYATFASAQCITVNSAFFTNPSGDGIHWSLNVNWTAQGVNHLKIYVKEGNDTVLNTCFQMNNPVQTTGTSIYDGIIAPGGLPSLSATFCRWTESCGSGVRCDENQFIPPGGVLDIAFEQLSARCYNTNTTEIKFRILSSSRHLTFNVRMNSGNVRKFVVKLPNNAVVGQAWTVLLDHVSGKYILIKP